MRCLEKGVFMYSIYTSCQLFCSRLYDNCTSAETNVLEMPVLGGDSSQPVETHPSRPLDVSAFRLSSVAEIPVCAFADLAGCRDASALPLGTLVPRRLIPSRNLVALHMYDHRAHPLRP